MRARTVDGAGPSERGTRLAPVLCAIGAVCAAIAATALVLLQSRSWACPQYFTHETGVPKDELLVVVFGAALLVGFVTSAVASVTWWRATRWPDGATAAVRRRYDARRAWAGRAALLGLVPLAVLLVLMLGAPGLLAHCGD